MLVIPKEITRYSTYSSKDFQTMPWRPYLYPPSQLTTKVLRIKPSKLLNPGCWSKESSKPGDNRTLEVLIKEEPTAFNNWHTNQINPFKVEGQGSSVATKEDKEISLTNNAAQAFTPREEGRQDLSIIPPMYLGGWLTSLFQWT